MMFDIVQTFKMQEQVTQTYILRLKQATLEAFQERLKWMYIAGVFKN